MNEHALHALLSALEHHIGAANGVSASALAMKAWENDSPGSLRRLRQGIEALRREGKPVCGRPETGYYIAETPEELDAAVEYLHDRGMTSITQAAKMRNVSVPDIRGQLRLRT